MPPKKRNVTSVGSIMPSSSGGFSGGTHSEHFRKRKKNNRGGCLFVVDGISQGGSGMIGACDLTGSSSMMSLDVPDANASTLATSSVPSSVVTNAYTDLGDCNCVCSYCGATFWYDERLKNSANRLDFSRCCERGRVDLPRERDPPPTFIDLLGSRGYMDNIRAYNQLFSMASYGAHIDNSVNNGRGPYVFKISGQIYHWIGSLCPEEGDPPRFLQLYIYDTVNEVSNRKRFFGGEESDSIGDEIVSRLIDTLNSDNELVKLFRTARDKIAENDVPDLKVRLYSAVGAKQYELPKSDALGAVVYETGERSRTDYDVIIECKGGTPQRVNKLHPSYMSLQFPLLFVYGQPGYHPELTLRKLTPSSNRKKEKLTMNMFYCYQLHDRYNTFNFLSKCGRLFQQYIVTAYCSIELDRLDYVRKKQRDIRNEYLSGLYDALNRGDQYGSEVGSRTILPASFTGGPRYMYSHYLDALAICRVKGNPHLFITFTCNTKWPEITRDTKRYPNLTSNDRADIIARVFHMKLKEFVSVLKEEELFGPYNDAVMFTVEFQKRGLPHCHTLLWLKSAGRSFEASDIDRFISAELPDPRKDPDGHKVISEMMIHGPCGLLNKSAPCMEQQACSKKIPKPFNERTYFDADGIVRYRRRNLDTYAQKGPYKLDNGYVVPYNRELCTRFHAHINVEWCGWTMLIKYLFKYISKGTDRILAHVPRPIGSAASSSTAQQSNIDEIQNFIDARFICPHEASWRILNFPIHHREPAVQVLAVHLEDMQLVSFRSTQRIHSIVKNPVQKKTTLTEWLFYNQHSVDGRHLTYLDFPSEFVWVGTEKRWKRRCNLNKPSVGRLSYMHPAFGEVFYLRMLLCHQKGSTSFKDLITTGGMAYGTYRETCLVMGLLGDDKEWLTAMEEASASATSAELRLLFCHILLFCEVADPLKLWKQSWRLMSDDIPIRAASSLHMSELIINPNELQTYTLYELQIVLSRYSECVTDFNLPRIPQHLLDDLQNRLIMEERNYDREALAAEKVVLLSKLNEKQRKVYDLIVSSYSHQEQQLIFVYGHGGTGKTFLWKAITTALRSEGKIVLVVASSGIASLLLPSGQTAHSKFKIPIDLTDESVCNIKKKTNIANLLCQTELIIWDEVPMNDRKCLEALDRTLRDIFDAPDSAFGGLSMVLGVTSSIRA